MYMKPENDCKCIQIYVGLNSFDVQNFLFAYPRLFEDKLDKILFFK